MVPRGHPGVEVSEMSRIIAAARVGDVLRLRHAGGRPTRYKVRKESGKRARELGLDGQRGARRVLVNGGDAIWIREASAKASDGSAHRRVVEIRFVDCPSRLNAIVAADILERLARPGRTPQPDTTGPGPAVGQTSRVGELKREAEKAVDRLLRDPDRMRRALDPVGVVSASSAMTRACVRVDDILGDVKALPEALGVHVDDLISELLLLKVIQVRSAQEHAPKS